MMHSHAQNVAQCVSDLPLPGSMSAIQAAYSASRARKLHRVGRMTSKTYAVFDFLLWEKRERGANRAIASYSEIQDGTHFPRGTVAKAIRELVACGLMQKVKHRILELWNNGGRRWRRLASEYVFHSESTTQTDSKKQESKEVDLPLGTVAARVAREREETLVIYREPSTAEARAAQEALAEHRAKSEAKAAENWRNRTGRRGR